ncbi:MAG: membrane protein insertion efficiency factor YidD [Clostridia bacterium]|nr:membrane protein insertion efficiency factor YidD [Clostridia bacterium]
MKRVVIKLIRIYKKFFSPLFPRSCRFYPSCSQFSVLSIDSYGLILGLYCTLRRIFKCHPFNPGGVEYPQVYENDFVFKVIKRALNGFKIVGNGNFSKKGEY